MDVLRFALEIDLHGKIHKEISVTDIQFQKGKIYWIHADLNDRALLDGLGVPDQFFKQEMVSSVVDQGQNLIIRLPSLIPDLQESVPLSMYLSKTVFISACSRELSFINQVRLEIAQNIKYAKTPGFILFLILDHMVNYYLDTVEKYDSAANALELTIYEQHDGSYTDVVAIKKETSRIKQQAIVLRDLLIRITGHKIGVISEACRLSFLNVLDSAKVMISHLDAIRDLLGISIGLIENGLRQKLNDTLRFLTVISSIFLPFTGLLKLYEMNLGIEWALAPLVVLVGFVVYYVYRWFRW